MIDFYLPKRKLTIEVDELGYQDRKPEKENIRQKKQQKNILGVRLLGLILMKKILVLMMGLVKYRRLFVS